MHQHYQQSFLSVSYKLTFWRKTFFNKQVHCHSVNFISSVNMDNIKHWWNLTHCLSKLDGEGVNSCRMRFVERCRRLFNQLELPKQNFGPSVMCSYCGSLWSKNEFQTRIVPGKAYSKSVKQIIRSSENNTLSRFRSTLLKKSLKNKMNKVVIKCSVCSKNTEICLAKPKRPKLVEKDAEKSGNTVHRKKKKNKGKDKSAGLDLSGIRSPDTREKREMTLTASTPALVKAKKSQKKQMTPLQQVRKLNLHKLNNMLNESKAQKSKSSLNNFLKELY